jgi:hypothetical protein
MCVRVTVIIDHISVDQMTGICTELTGPVCRARILFADKT